MQKKLFIWAVAVLVNVISLACASAPIANFKSVPSLIVSPSTTPTETSGLPPTSKWPSYRQETLGVEVRYPPGWQPFDQTQSFVRFMAPNQSEEAFNIVNAPLGPIHRATDFLTYIKLPVAITRTLVIDGQSAIFMQFKAGQETSGYQSMVGLIRPDGHTLTVGNRTIDTVLFEQIISTIHFFEAVNPPW